MTDETAEVYADSTIAMTLYNVLCIIPGAANIKQLHELAMKTQHVSLSLLQTERGLAGLVERNRIVKNGGQYSLVAKQKLMVVQRDLGDYNSKTMKGGWEGWQIKDPRIRDGKGTRPLEGEIGQTLTGRKPRSLPSAVKPNRPPADAGRSKFERIIAASRATKETK